MREIKFRQWLSRNKNWHYFGFKEEEVSGVVSATLSENPIQQFTGLLDKNGKEIYEGDIVTCHTTTFNYPHKGQVIYLQHVCGFGITTEPIVNERTGLEEEAFTYFNYNEDFEIIGNIYQHPELIEEA